MRKSLDELTLVSQIMETQATRAITYYQLNLMQGPKQPIDETCKVSSSGFCFFYTSLFATRLLERGVHHFVISALLGHSTPMTSFAAASRMTPGNAHATWDTMVAAVAALEQPLPLKQISFAVSGSLAKRDQVRKVS